MLKLNFNQLKELGYKVYLTDDEVVIIPADTDVITPSTRLIEDLSEAFPNVPIEMVETHAREMLNKISAHQVITLSHK